MDYNEHKMLSIRDDLRKKIIIAIAVAAALIAVVSTAVFFVVTSGTSRNDSGNTNINSSNLGLSGDLTFCVACAEDDGSKLDFIAVVRAQLYNRTFYVTPVDVSSSVKWDNVSCSLSDHLKKGGMAELTSAVEILCSAKCDRYIYVTKSDLSLIFAHLGHITLDIPVKVELTVSEGKVVIEAGERELDYEETADYLINGCKSGNRLEFQGDVICSIIRQYIENADYSKSQKIFDDIINYVTTDITAMDYSNAQNCISYFPETTFSFVNTLS